jgi:hypothetical protein
MMNNVGIVQSTSYNNYQQHITLTYEGGTTENVSEEHIYVYIS